MTPEQRAWYLGGVYDRASIDLTTTKCTDRVPFPRFVEEVQRFVVGLPAEADSPDRRAMDNTPAALAAQRVLDRVCAR